MKLRIEDFRDWLYERIEDDDGIVVIDTVQFSDWGYRGFACPLHEFIMDQHGMNCGVDVSEIEYDPDDLDEYEIHRPPQWARDFMEGIDAKHDIQHPVGVPDAYDCLAILDEIEAGKRRK